MPLYDKTVQTIEQTFKSLKAIQDAGFNAAAAVAEKVPGLPGRVASSTTRGTSAWVESYFTFAQRVLDAERETAEKLASLNKVLVSPRTRAESEESLRAV